MDTPTPTPFLTVERHGRVAVLTMNRPEVLNAITSIEDCDCIVDTFFALGNDRSVSAIVLTGSGRAFSSGGNVKAMQQRTGIGVLEQPDSTRANYRRGVQRAVRAMLECEVPMIAAINGHAIGLGLDLACLCDIRLAADTAKMAASFIKVGIVPGDGGAWTLQRIVGYSLAAELFLTGRQFDAAYAQSIGLVGRVVPAEDLLPAAIAIGQEIAANPPRALRLTKRLLREAQHGRAHDVLELSAAYQAIAHETQDHGEAVAAILEKRPPHFTGD